MKGSAIAMAMGWAKKSIPRRVLYQASVGLKPVKDVCPNSAADLQAAQQPILLKANVFVVNIGIE